jgi:hypothetical protein
MALLDVIVYEQSALSAYGPEVTVPEAAVNEPEPEKHAHETPGTLNVGHADWKVEPHLV